MLDTVIRAQVIYRLSPTILLIGSQWKLVLLLDFCFFLHIKMAIPLSFLIVVILVLLQLIELVGLLQSAVIFAIDRKVARDLLVLGDLF